MDIVIYAVKLTSQIGAQGPAKMFAYLVFSGLVLTRLRQPVGRLTADEQKLEGEFRYVNSRLITNRYVHMVLVAIVYQSFTYTCSWFNSAGDTVSWDENVD